MSDYETSVGDHSGSEMQCHVPIEALRDHGLEPGDCVEWHVTNRSIVGWPTRGGETERPEIVCLCGSTRFADAFLDEQFRLTVEGKMVLTVAGCWKDSHDDAWAEIDDRDKERLDALHFRKIELADRVHVLNVDGYVGSSTTNEVEHAIETGTDVTWLEPGHIPEQFQEVAP